MREEPDIVKELKGKENLDYLYTSSITAFIKNNEADKQEKDKSDSYFNDIYNENYEKKDDMLENETLFKDLFENANDLIQSCDSEGRFLFVNKKWKDRLGYSDDDLKNLTIWDVIAQSHHDKCKQAFGKLLKGETLESIQTIFKTKNGEEINVEGNINAHFIGKEFVSTRAIFRDITERLESEKKLKISEERYGVLFNASPEMIHQVDANGIIVDTNPSITRILGYSQEDVIGKKLSDIFADNSKKIFDEKLHELSDKGYGESEIEVVCKDGSIKNVFCSRTALYDDNAKFTGGVFYQHDITGEKKAQEQIKQSEERYRTMFESANDGIIIIEKKGGITDINQTASDLFGRPREEYIGKNLKDVMHLFTKKSQIKILKNFAVRMLGKQVLPYEVEMYTQEGEIKTVEINAVPLKRDDKVYGDLAILRDVSFRKKAEESLKENEERLRVVLESVKEGITFSDESGRFEIFNPEMQRLTGYSLNEVNDYSDFSSMLYPDSKDRDKALEGLNTLIKSGDIYETETRIKTKNGDIIDLLVSTTIVYYQDKKMFLSAYRDITNNKKLREELKEKINKLEAYKESTIDRELKMIQLKNEINELCVKYGEKPKYVMKNKTENNIN